MTTPLYPGAHPGAFPTVGGSGVAGTAVASLAGLTAFASGSGSSDPLVIASLGGLTGSVNGARETFGTGAAPLGALTGQATVANTVTGTAVANLGVLTGTVASVRTRGVLYPDRYPDDYPAGAVVPPIATTELGPLAASGAGTRTVVALAALILDGIAATALGVRETYAVAAADLGAVGAAAVGEPNTIIAFVQLAPLAATASGERTVTAVASVTFDAVAGAVALRDVYGTAAVSAAVNAAVSGSRVRAGSAEVALSGISAHASGAANIGFPRVRAGAPTVVSVVSAGLPYVLIGAGAPR